MSSRRLLLRSLLTLLAGITVIHPTHAQDEAVPWFDNYADALREARRSGKPIFLEFRCEP
ncbi:MAG: hypothetical protein IT168_25670 [Bryobacterales bacterium]|nr:hypothetical protein [Bryobacterales bacterium]